MVARDNIQIDMKAQNTTACAVAIIAVMFIIGVAFLIALTADLATLNKNLELQNQALMDIYALTATQNK